MTGKAKGNRSAYERYGGGHVLMAQASDGATAAEPAIELGKIITLDGGPGKGFGMVPWALGRYEQVLQLDINEAWLLRRMIEHIWAWDGLWWESFSKIELQASVKRETVSGWVDKLCEKGYARKAGRLSQGPKRVMRYSVQGIFYALAICILVDPHSEWAHKGNTPITVEDASRLAGSFDNTPSPETVTFDLDFEALAKLVDYENNNPNGEWWAESKPTLRRDAPLQGQAKISACPPDEASERIGVPLEGESGCPEIGAQIIVTISRDMSEAKNVIRRQADVCQVVTDFARVSR